MSLLQFEQVESADTFSVVIVGAGISGLYCAWRLIREDPERKIAVVERLNRTGGRLNTDIIEIKPGEVVREEEGGMRFNYEMQELMSLSAELGLCDEIVPFPMTSVDDTNRFLLRGHSFTAADAEASDNMIWGEIYDLKSEEIGLSPTDLVTNAYKNILFENGAEYLSGRKPCFWTEFRETFTWNGKTMNEWQLWGLLRDMNYSEECILMLSETIGFSGPFHSLANAGDAMQILADFPKDPTYYTFRCGFSTLPDAVVDDLEANYADKVRIFLSTNVDSVRSAGDGFELDLTEAPLENANPFIPGGVSKSIRAEKLILAVATSGLEKLFITSPALNQHEDAHALWEDIHAAMGMKLMKINLYFDKPWWQNGQTSRPSVQFGPNFTSLPANAVYPFYSLEAREQLMRRATETSEICDGAAALTIYCDFNNTNFWHGLQRIGQRFESELQEQQNNKRPQTLYAASRAVVDEAKKQLRAIFDVNWVPEPILTSYRLWDGEDDFEYAYHQWRLGIVDSEVRKRLASPFANLFVCNEAISDMQGWVNGSIRSSDCVLEHFGLEKLSNEACVDKTPRKSAKALPTPGKHRVAALWGG